MSLAGSSPSILSHYLLVAVPFRILNALLSRSFFQPDEFWQSLEIAHSIAFGYGYRTWEWRSIAGSGGIRSPILPWLFSRIYVLLAKVGLDDTAWLVRATESSSEDDGLIKDVAQVLAPKIAQAFVAAWCDYSTFKLARRLLGPRHQNAAVRTLF